MTRQLYFDESVWAPVADGLRARGWSVTTAFEEDTLGEPDREQLAYARRNDWLLVTFDDDFLGLVHREELEHVGILYVDQHGRRIGDVVHAIDAFLDLHGTAFRDVGYP